jgi:hypothetical protein
MKWKLVRVELVLQKATLNVGVNEWYIMQ